MNILADRHHAGLLYSLQLLFEDRLGMQLYVPVGHDWWDEGFWRFGEVFGDDRLAQQYLNENDASWSLHESTMYWVSEDPEFPGREIRGVTLEQYKALDWAYTLASVQENQLGFDHLAKLSGAQAIYSIGNTGQRCDWSLDPLVLVSAEAEIQGRGLRYHQEFDSDGVFDFADPRKADRFRVHSYVNLFPRIETWPFFSEAKEQLVGWTTRVHGHDGLDGVVKPTSVIAKGMASAGWGWHDKPTGDGFGHVIHGWAAVGRPLIGHSHFYRGKLAAPFWEDGVTCIDLNEHSVTETVMLMNKIARDPVRHAAMCLEINDRFNELVNYDAEEQQIRALLGL